MKILGHQVLVNIEVFVNIPQDTVVVYVQYFSRTARPICSKLSGMFINGPGKVFCYWSKRNTAFESSFLLFLRCLGYPITYVTTTLSESLRSLVRNHQNWKDHKNLNLHRRKGWNLVQNLCKKSSYADNAAYLCTGFISCQYLC